MTDFDTVDYFTDQTLVPDPHPYYDHLRAKCPVTEVAHGVVAVTGYEETADAMRSGETLSSMVALGGPFPPLPFEVAGDDLTELIAEHRHKMPMFEHMVTMDPPEHTYARSLLNRLLTPARLKENEEFMWRLADAHLDEFVADGRCDFLASYAKPFSLLVVADVLGVPEEDHKQFRVVLGADRPGARVGALDEDIVSANPLDFLDEKFSAYIADRRREPRDDVLTQLALAKYPDGSTPEIIEVVRSATFLFAAGQETTAKLLTSALRFLGDNPELQERLRADRGKIPLFIEETLRLEAPVKSLFRLTKRDTSLGEVQVPVGKVVMLCPGAANRDPRRFDEPHEFRLDRPNAREHMAFGRGVHTCPGGPLARVEGRVSIERILDRMLDIRIDEDKHGPRDARRYEYEPTYILRGLRELHIEFTPNDEQRKPR
ncbi:cytochrome P450 [Nocardia sp. NPDC004068]|uniref:cytochrome P450 n=1 Tax=Nocardia sp. NPDC004068 TaxID=3364303 RepID=UPI0036AF2A80